MIPANAERAILHSVLLWPQTMDAVVRRLTPEDFEITRHRKLYASALNMWRSKRPIEADLWARECAGGIEREYTTVLAYVATLEGGTPNPKAVSSYAKVVADAAKERKLKRILEAALASRGPHHETARNLSAALAEFTPSTEESRELLVSAVRLCSTLPEQIDWLVDGVIPRGGNGIIAGEPKAGKSWVSEELALCLASGSPFLGKQVRRPVRTALFSREDYPGLTSWRLRALFKSRAWPNPNFFDETLFVNTRAQSDEFSIHNAAHVQEVIEALEKHRIEFAIFDVLNILHAADENDNTEMRQVMNRFTEIQTRAKCSIALVHHLGKAEGKWTRRLRGASSIHGWVEWLIGVSEADPDTKLRKLEFELKAGQAPEPIYYTIDSEQETNTALLRLRNAPPAGQSERSVAGLWRQQ